MITEDEFKTAWIIVKNRATDLPNAIFVIEKYVFELETQNKAFHRNLENAVRQAAKEMEERNE